MLRFLLVSLVLLLWCISSQAQSQPCAPAQNAAPCQPQAAHQTAAAVPAVAVDAGTISLAARDSITVTAIAGSSSILGEPSLRISQEALEEAAGTMGDPVRYFQFLPGVKTDSDQRNDFIVRGGNPSETLFVVDGIEVPSINQLALSDTTGGLVSMVDSEAIESMTLHSGARSAAFSDRLSSVVEIATIATPDAPRGLRGTAEAGFAGAGGIVSWQMGTKGSLLLSERQSVLNLFTNDIGIGGVPIYNNNLVQADRSIGARDRIWGMSLSGVDSIALRPTADEAAGTNLFNVNYSGWRNASGANWQHAFNAKTFGALTASNSEQSQSIVEYDPLMKNQSTYNESTRDGDSTAKYEVTTQPWHQLLLSGGVVASQQRVNYTLAQPVALPNPYSENPASGSATAIQSAFSAPRTGGFIQLTLRLPAGIRVTAAARATHWGFDQETRWTPKAFLAVPLGKERSLGLGYAEYTQLPAFLYLLAFPQNHGLLPIAARQYTVDLTDLVRTGSVSLGFSAYEKRYSDYPVASGYPQLSLANIADTFGQSFLLFPMVSGGNGRNAGLEASLSLRIRTRLAIQTNATYARAWYSGLDRVLRRGSFDIPFSANVGAVWKIRRSLVLSARYAGASGRPYTPDIISLSYAQKRDVYNLALINARRSQTYQRLDFRFEQSHTIKRGLLTWYAGLQNATDHQNFYAYLWKPNGGGDYEEDQMPLFPDGGIKYAF
jgi:hypothetical protein